MSRGRAVQEPGPFVRAWRAYKKARWAYPVEPDFYRTVRKAFKAGFRAAERELVSRVRPSCILTAMTIEQLAEKAYDAYGAVTDHKNYQGLPMPAWADLTPKIREAWRAATSATVIHCVDAHARGEKPLTHLAIETADLDEHPEFGKASIE